MNSTIQLFSIKNSRWITSYTKQFCNSDAFLPVAGEPQPQLAPAAAGGLGAAGHPARPVDRLRAGIPPGASRSKVALQKTTEVAAQMVARSIAEGTPADYVVFDNWFAVPPGLPDLRERWAIEVFFKQTKQRLGLASELQVRSYTACVAHSSIVFLRYMMLAYLSTPAMR